MMLERFLVSRERVAFTFLGGFERMEHVSEPGPRGVGI
jgi:hypothetical protein